MLSLVVWVHLLNLLDIPLDRRKIGLFVPAVLFQKCTGPDVSKDQIGHPFKWITFVVCVSIDFVTILLMNDNKNVRIEALYNSFSFAKKTSFWDIERVILVTLQACCWSTTGILVTLLFFDVFGTTSTAPFLALVCTWFFVCLRHIVSNWNMLNSMQN